MCRRVNCEKCGKPSWAGCGAHVEQVLGDVPKERRCTCRERSSESTPPPVTRSGPWWMPWR